MKKEGTLTELQRRFVQEYVKDYCGQQAYLRTNPEVDKHTAEVNASKLLKKPEVIQYLKELQDAALMKYGDIGKFLLKELTEDVEKKDADGNHNAGWQKSVDLIQKQLGLQKQEIKADVQQTVQFLDDMGEV